MAAVDNSQRDRSSHTMVRDTAYSTSLHFDLQLKAAAMEEVRANSKALMEDERRKYKTQITIRYWHDQMVSSLTLH